ncbi:SH3 domain-containing protein [Yoonia litorea]|uniref:SH3-like domain-containing protein n=1 Tax=Yoonia litorea TaxID=1123755 RepID=A0A1I6L863_9RHOB|nr:SH3 domain-containing protein [Yoonia litorea]SFR99681.1 SH3-like domain-containing protein [Yoonia litorea]
MKRLTQGLGVVLVCLFAQLGSFLHAQELAAGPAIGPETNLPLPRFVSLRASEANVRRGPSLSHRIDWVFKRRDMPLQVIAEYGHWRRVIDRDGQGGWVHFRMLSGARTAIVMGAEQIPLRARPEDNAIETALLEPGVIGRLGECDPDWCRLSAGGYRGWVHRSALWGIGEAEIRD